MTNNTDPVRALIADWREEAAECHAESETPAVKRDPRAYAGFASASRMLTRCADELESALASAPPSAPVGVEWPAGVLSREQTMKTLREHNAWRRGARGPQTDSRLLGLALDAAIAALAQQPAAPSGEAAAEVVHADGAPGGVLIKRMPGVGRNIPHGTKLYATPQQPAGVDEDAAEALRFLLTRIGSWTNARWDQHLRHEFGDDRAGRMITALAAKQQGGA